MNKIIQLKKGTDKYFPKIKREVATSKLTQRYLQYQNQPWVGVKVNLNQLNSTTSKLTLVDNGIKIGKGIKKVLVSGQIAFWKNQSPSLSYLQADILKNKISIAFNTYFHEAPYQVSCSLNPILIDVKENDLIQIASSFGNAVTNFTILENGTYLTVEVVE